MRLWIPFPISVNRLYPGKVRRYKSKEYEAWIVESTLILNQQSKEYFIDPVDIIYKFGQPDKRRRDIDNLFKCCNDLLVSYGIIKDDSLIHKISGEWANITGTQIEIIKMAANP